MAVADAVGFERFHLVGHDWGAVVGWQTVFTDAQRLDSYTALSIPHIVSFGNALANNQEQQDKSGYMAFFRTPWVSENVFAFNDHAMLRGIYSAHPAAEAEEYVSVLSEPGAMTAALNWYRAGGVGGGGAANPNVSTPTLFVWGNQDVAVSRAAVDGQDGFMQGPFEEIELPTGHWLMATATERVTTAVLAHLERN